MYNNEQLFYVATMAAARAVAKVALRCEDAKTDRKLDLRECQLARVPDAVYFLLKETPPTSCDLSVNCMKKIHPKFCIKFDGLTELDLSENKLTQLPDNFGDKMTNLTYLNIGFNQFGVLPDQVYQMPHLEELNAEGNEITAVHPEALKRMPNLRVVNLQGNPLVQWSYDGLQMLQRVTDIQIILPDREDNYSTMD